MAVLGDIGFGVTQRSDLEGREREAAEDRHRRGRRYAMSRTESPRNSVRFIKSQSHNTLANTF